MKLHTIPLLSLAAALAWPGAILAAPAAAPSPIHVGMKAPDFALPANDGKTYKLSKERGHWVVLAFYPKDFTGG